MDAHMVIVARFQQVVGELFAPAALAGFKDHELDRASIDPSALTSRSRMNRMLSWASLIWRSVMSSSGRLPASMSRARLARLSPMRDCPSAAST